MQCLGGSNACGVDAISPDPREVGAKEGGGRGAMREEDARTRVQMPWTERHGRERGGRG